MDACRILVVEDDSDINALLCRILSGAGYRVDSAFSGTEAQLRLQMEEYDLLLLDLMLSTTIQRETKLFLGADNEETAELTVPMYDFGDWASKMKAYRKKNHITQQELAQLMGVKHFTLRSWEQKQAKPPYNVWRLHKHLFDDSIKLT